MPETGTQEDRPEWMVGGLNTPMEPWALRTIATLRIADLMAAGPGHLDDLATKAEVDRDALGSLLRFLCCRGIFTEPTRDTFALTDAAGPLLSDNPKSMLPWLDARGAGVRMDVAMCLGLLEAVRTGKASYPSVHGRSFWDDLDADPGLAASFDRLMAGTAAMWVPEVVSGFDWSALGHVADIGGGDGALLRALLAANPGLLGTLVEQEKTAARARVAFEDAGVTNRISIVERTFFDELPGGADAYVLAQILHNWDDEDAARILARCASAAGKSGRVMVVERTNSEIGRQREFTEMDLRMLILFGGRERTLGQLSVLADKVGLQLQTHHHTRVGLAILEFVSG